MNTIDKKNNDKFSFIFARFEDSNLEKEFVNYDIRDSVKYFKPILLIFGILYLLFAIPDYFLNTNKVIFGLILFLRFIFIVLMFVFYYKLKNSTTYEFYFRWVTLSKIFIALIYLLIYSIYESPNFLIQAFGIIVIILAFFIVPNKSINKVYVSVILSSGFFIISVVHFEILKLNEFLAAIAYIFITIVLCSISAYRADYHKRMEFLNNKELQRLSKTDALTGIYNRYKFDEELRDAINFSKRYETQLALILFDFDNFKEINDNFGHVVGDMVLKDTAELVNKSIRNTDVFARWGGEEFVILLPSTRLENAVELAEKIRIKINNFEFKHNEKVTCSFGITPIRKDDDRHTLLKRVDELLYEAKKLGKNKVKF